MEALYNTIDRVRLHFINLQRFAEREKNLSEIVAPYFAYGGNQTWTANSATEYAIHYSIASRPFLSVSDNPSNPSSWYSPIFKAISAVSVAIG